MIAGYRFTETTVKMSTTARMLEDLANNYVVPTRGAPDFKALESTELSVLRLGIHLGSDPC